MKKNVLCLMLAICLTLASVSGAFAADGPAARDLAQEEMLAYSLKALGLFKGVSDTDLALGRAPTRAEALVMLLRLLGVEQEALAEQNTHPFLDTDDCRWAEPYIGYAYAHGLTKGVSATVFGGMAAASAETYLTFVLRALGYEEGKDGDFTWNSPFRLAQTLNLLPPQVRLSSFLRADVVSVSYAALNVPCKGSGKTLAQTLTDKGVLTGTALARYYDAEAAATGTLSGSVSDNVTEYMRPYRIAGGIDISGLPRANYGTVAMIGDAGYELYGFYSQGIDRCAGQIRTAAETLGDSGRVFAIVVPNRLGTVLSYADFSRVCSPVKNETEAIDYYYGQLGGAVRTVDAVSELRLHNREDVFFRTDHHWTALGAYYAYTAWAETAGFTPAALDSFSTLDMPGHLGLFYSMCGNPYAMKQNPDTVTAYIPADIDSIRVEITEANGSTHAGELICDCTGSSYKYAAFLGGDHPLTTITNDAIADDSACVLVKDSYGNPFAPFLTQHYHTVYVIDYRYYKNVYGYLTFSRFAEERGVKDFIVLLPMTLSQSDTTASALGCYCK